MFGDLSVLLGVVIIDMPEPAKSALPQQFQKKAPHLHVESSTVHTEGIPKNTTLSVSVPTACALANRNQQCNQTEGSQPH